MVLIYIINLWIELRLKQILNIFINIWNIMHNIMFINYNFLIIIIKRWIWMGGLKVN